MASEVNWTDAMLLEELKKCMGGRHPSEIKPGEVIDVPDWLIVALERHTGIPAEYAEFPTDD